MRIGILALALAAAAGPALAQVPGMPLRPVSAPVEAAVDAPAPAPAPARQADPAPGPGLDQAIDAASELRNSVVAAQRALPAGAPSSGAVRPPPSQLELPSGRNEMVQVARNQPNRFVTPFAVPVVRFTNELTSVEVEGKTVFVTTASTSPVTIYIEDDATPENTFVLTLVPKDVPAVSITLKGIGMRAGSSPASAEAAQAFEQSDHFVAVIRDTFKELAQGRVPPGYGLATVADYTAVPECLMPGLNMEPGQTVTGAKIVVYVARLTNRTRIPQSVNEEGCASDRVLAVAAWPHVEVMPGQSTELFIATRRETAPPANVRPSLIH